MNNTDTIRVTLCLKDEEQEHAMALLAAEGFYAFEEHPDKLEAYISPADFASLSLPEWVGMHFPGLSQEPVTEVMPARDWNAEWESNFQPVVVGSFCLIRAPFHPAQPGVKIDLQILPKMSFGTGHHATTRMVVSQCEKLDFTGKRVLDVGTGTGVLGILASKLGAKEIAGVDIDPWSYENAQENAAMNDVSNFEVIQGTIENAPGPCYDILLANINRNIIITDRDAYMSRLCRGGSIVLSGFLKADEARVRQHYEAAGLELLFTTEDSGWVSLSFQAS